MTIFGEAVKHSFLLGELLQEGLDEDILGHVSEALGGLGFAHRLGLVDGNLGNLRIGKGSVNHEVLRVKHGV